MSIQVDIIFSYLFLIFAIYFIRIKSNKSFIKINNTKLLLKILKIFSFSQTKVP